jgi:N-acetylneuraminate synthase
MNNNKKKILDIFSTDFKSNNGFYLPYIIAEAGVNHDGKIDVAKRLIDEAREGGADAIKFQTYRAHTLASANSPAYWDTSKEPIDNQFKLFQKYDNFWKSEFEILKYYCDEVGIEFMSTPFDNESATFLNDLMSIFKISSSDITNKPFIEFIANFGKPLILSTGASNINEIQHAVDWIENSNNNQLALLHCILNYPTEDQNANLGMIESLKINFPSKIIGYSDHTLPKNMKVLELAFLLGARIIEKHFTHDKTLKGNDHYHAMDKDDLILFNKNLESIIELYGKENKTALDSEEPARINARRSIVANTDIKKGTIISSSHIALKRPAHGIEPKYYKDVIGMKALRDIRDDEVLQWTDFE